MSRSLFICKQTDTQCSPGYQYFRKFSGLFNSARFVSLMLNTRFGHDSKVVVAIDNNCIDRLVTENRPDVVFIEALWVVPEKFEVLKRLHPNVKWVVRLHSQIPFLAGEGIAIEWSLRYIREQGITVAPNTPELTADLKYLVRQQGGNPGLVEYLPNYYDVDCPAVQDAIDSVEYPEGTLKEVNIGCFGAIRPLKNQLEQAVAAMKFADSIGAHLNFHINGNRVEQGHPHLKNIRALFEHSPHTLVEHAWQPHAEFLKLCATMDIGLQVSYSESYNIVMADMVAVNVPVVTSDSIEHVNPLFYADPNSTDSIVAALRRAWFGSYVGLQRLNKNRLRAIGRQSKAIWFRYIDRLVLLTSLK